LYLNDTAIVSAGPVPFFHELLGSPSRVYSGAQPAPAGHRNNQIHIYDSLGLYLNEHHCTYQISAVTFVFVPDESPFPPAQPFSGELQLGETALRPGMDESVLNGCALPLLQKLRGSWTLEDGTVWISVDTMGRKTRSGRRGKRRFVIAVNACLPKDPWGDRYRPS
jgi:hypothetical protein